MNEKEEKTIKNGNAQDDESIIGEVRIGDMPPTLVVGPRNKIIRLDSTPDDESFDIFISYARADGEFVQGIYEALVNNQRHPWMDIYSLKGGEEWLGAINKAIEECEIFLAVLSNNSVSRRGIIQKELKKALDKWEGMLPGDIYIIPIRIDDCPIPELLKHIQVLDWSGGKGEKKLLEAVRVGMARRKDDKVGEINKNKTDKDLIQKVLGACNTRAIFTRTHAQLNHKAMFESLSSSRVVLQKIQPQFESKHDQQMIADVIGQLDFIERNEKDFDKINQAKLSIIASLQNLSVSAGIPFVLPQSPTEEVFFSLEDANKPPSNVGK